MFYVLRDRVAGSDSLPVGGYILWEILCKFPVFLIVLTVLEKSVQRISFQVKFSDQFEKICRAKHGCMNLQLPSSFRSSYDHVSPTEHKRCPPSMLVLPVVLTEIS